jgi:hypothetical protein
MQRGKLLGMASYFLGLLYASAGSAVLSNLARGLYPDSPLLSGCRGHTQPVPLPPLLQWRRLHAATHGLGSGKPLMLLLHGFPETWASWRHQIKVGLGDVEGAGYAPAERLLHGAWALSPRVA